jgi:hypothetical protein
MGGLGLLRAERAWIPRFASCPHPSLPTSQSASLLPKKKKKLIFPLLTNSHPGIAGGPVLEAVKGEERAFVALVGWENVAVHEVSAPPPPILNPDR